MGFLGERVETDIMDPLPLTKKGNYYILVIVDYFTKVAEAEPMKSQDPETVASTFFNNLICQHGVKVLILKADSLLNYAQSSDSQTCTRRLENRWETDGWKKRIAPR
ncbi:hypothetical protein TSMEX_000600 [Taenia solium]|eukprot:TsM_001118500 transcript=TsM_001118500 gene=TsM_001118500